MSKCNTFKKVYLVYILVIAINGTINAQNQDRTNPLSYETESQVSSNFERQKDLYVNAAVRISQVLITIALALRLKRAVNKIQKGENALDEAVKWGVLLFFAIISIELLLMMFKNYMSVNLQ